MNGPELLTGNMMELIICEMMLFLMGSPILDAAPFQPFLSITGSYFIIYIPSHMYFGAVYQFNQLAHREKEEGLLGRGEGRREGTQSAPPFPPIVTVMHLY